jgi:hypothetical protein
MKTIISDAYKQSFLKFAQMMGDLENRDYETILKVVSDYAKHQGFMEAAARGQMQNLEYTKQRMISDVAQFFALYAIQDESERKNVWRSIRQAVDTVLDQLKPTPQPQAVPVEPFPRSF